MDASGQDKAYHTFFWEAMMINGTRINQLQIQDAPDMAKPMGVPTASRYKTWSNGVGSYLGINDYSQRYLVNVRSVSTSDLKKHEMYFALNWYNYNYGVNSKYDITADYYLLPISDTPNTGTNSYASFIYNAKYKGYDSLPLIRSSSGKNTVNDWLTNYQGSKEIRLPIPDWSEGQGYRMRSFMAIPDSDVYGMIYSVDADKLNVEFSEDLVDHGYFMLYYGDTLVDMQLITKRAYSYQYDFREGLKLFYGYADIDSFKYDLGQKGLKQGVDYQLEDIFGSPDYLYSLTDEPEVYSPAGLEHHVMTYRDKYYYINSEGIVSGTGSSVESNTVVNSSEDSDSSLNMGKTEIIDTTASTLSGNFITLYDGKALTEDRKVIDVEKGNELREVKEGLLPLDQTLPMQRFVLNGYSVETYSKFTEIVGEDEIVTRNQQLLKSMNNDFAMIDSDILNIKDSVVLYSKGEKSHCTILDIDGYVVDLYQGDEIGAPDDFRNSGIVYMTNNLKCSAPFILVEYSNGGIVGYNYMTGEYLFNHSINNVMSLLDYAKVYFTGDKSELLSISNTYAANSKLAKMAVTPERLLEIVEGNNSGNLVEGNSTGNGIKTGEDSITQKGSEIGMKAIENTGLKNDNNEQIESDNGSDAIITPEVMTNAKQIKNISDTPGIMGEAEELDSGNKNEMPVASVTAAVASTAANVEGEGLGTGTQMATQGDNSKIAAGNTEPEDSDNGTEDDSKVDLSKEEDLLSAELTESGLSEENSEGKSADKNDNQDKMDKEKKSISDSGEGGLEKVKNTDSTDEESESLISTAGTPVASEKTDGITNENVSYDSATEKDSEDRIDNTEAVETNEQLVTVYSMTTGTYEIIDLNQYLSAPSYQSENVKLAVRDLSVYSGYAQKDEKKHANGLGLYILVSMALLGGIGLTVRYRKRHKMIF